ncbi:glycine/betaine ABC transporter [Echinicola strongylocentroti]|uniref:Glycine/betaine ABC transporter n=1 Tax=Echinicola strongylocentroti TaxID=1795355 RepID=A0A2Z4IKQ0_9BACT|nr:BCCT family transporter [Echinicola strongylocentroti]AWW31692.1 glycine/betaine ABC transporter [Echinicola strongylocentroti]
MKKLASVLDTPIRRRVFWPPFLLILTAVGTSIFSPAVFESSLDRLNTFILDHFSLLFSYSSFAMVITCLLIVFSPLGKVRIGGKDARPKFNRISWFSIVLCTTVAVGILFWGSAEPLFHFLFPPSFTPFEGGEKEAAAFSMGAIFLHWGLTPYAIYAIPALGIALAIYNANLKFSLSSPLAPLLGPYGRTKLASWIDMICLFALVAGMSASLGAGILSISGGIADQWQSLNRDILLPLVTLAIICSFIVSASSGIDHGIKNLSQLNFSFFVIFSIIILFIGPTSAIMEAAYTGAGNYLKNVLPLSLQWGDVRNSEWTQSWSVFNWANWMAWAPITALFLGKIAYGRTVREFLLFTWLLPACFCLFWMSIFGGSTLYYASQSPELFKNLLETSGPESIIYEVFGNIGHTEILRPAFVIAMFISYVTAADSSTEAMASLSMKKFSLEDFDSDTTLKVVWGMLVGLLAWIMITFAGIDGVKMLSNLGGLPALLLLTGITISLNKLMWHPKKYLKRW